MYDTTIPKEACIQRHQQHTSKVEGEFLITHAAVLVVGRVAVDGGGGCIGRRGLWRVEDV
jgi:hypothetical protein